MFSLFSLWVDDVSNSASGSNPASSRWDLYWATVCELFLSPFDCDELTSSPCTWRKLRTLVKKATTSLKEGERRKMLPLILACGLLELQFLLLWYFGTFLAACGFFVLVSVLCLAFLHTLASMAHRVHVDGVFSGVRVDNALVHLRAYRVRLQTGNALLLHTTLPKELINIIVDFKDL